MVVAQLVRSVVPPQPSHSGSLPEFSSEQSFHAEIHSLNRGRNSNQPNSQANIAGELLYRLTRSET